MRCLVVRGEDEVLRFPVPAVEARLGSDPSNDLVVSIVGVSRFHARLVPDSIAPRLFDLDSKNGLVVNGKRYREVALLPGLVVQAGAARLSLEDGATSDFDLALEFRVTPAAARRPPENSAPITDTVTSSPAAREALGLLRALDRFGKEEGARPPTEELVDRLRRVLGARTVAILRDGPSGRDVVMVSGEAPDDRVLSALPEPGVATGALRFLELGGANGAFLPSSSPGALAALVLLPPAADFAPWQREFLGFSLDHLTDPRNALAKEVAASAPRHRHLVFPEGMVRGVSAAMGGLLGQIAKTVHSRIDVLIHGETGTGKELIARLIHASGPTAGGPFVAINCAAIPAELLESELFGVRGRVATGVDPQVGRILEANGGTLLLDEIGELPLSLQPKLLRFLQEREVHSIGASKPEKVNVRVVSISNRDLLADSRAGRFRSDLFYRLRGLQFHVPPLRDRKEDIAGLVAALAARAAEGEGKQVRGISRKALDLLEAYDWPGNVRELQAEVNRAVLFCPPGALLSAEHFRTVEWAVRQRAVVPHTEPAERIGESGLGGDHGADLTLKTHVDELERRLLEKALRSTGGNKSKAAELLGVTRAGLLLKLRRLLPDR
jgi:DNA-binding NtrC family response regulator